MYKSFEKLSICFHVCVIKGEPGVPEPEDWLVQELQSGQPVGFDPTLMSISK